VQIAAREGPLEGTGCLLISGLESYETLFEFGQRREIIRSEDLALDNRKVDLHLVNHACDGDASVMTDLFGK
jgi:hypothetical protein